MPVLDVSDQTYVPVAPALVRAHPSGPFPVSRWLPGLAVVPAVDRGEEGVIWRAAAVVAGRRWHGTAEIWLEPWPPGAVVHLYVRLDPDPDPDADPGPYPGADRHPHLDADVAVREGRRAREALVDRWKSHLLRWRWSVESSGPGDGEPMTRL